MSVVSLESTLSFSVPGASNPVLEAWRQSTTNLASGLLTPTPTPTPARAARTPPPPYASAGPPAPPYPQDAMEFDLRTARRGRAGTRVPNLVRDPDFDEMPTPSALGVPDEPVGRRSTSRAPTTTARPSSRPSAERRRSPSPQPPFREVSRNPVMSGALVAAEPSRVRSRTPVAPRPILRGQSRGRGGGAATREIAPEDSASNASPSRSNSRSRRSTSPTGSVSSQTSLTESSVDRIARKVVSFGGTLGPTSVRRQMPVIQEEANSAATHPRRRKRKEVATPERLKLAATLAFSPGVTVTKDRHGNLAFRRKTS